MTMDSKDQVTAPQAEVTLLCEQGRALLDECRFAEAMDRFSAALTQVPENADLLLNLGLSLYGMGRDEDAVTAYARILATQPDHVGALVNQALALRRLGLSSLALDNLGRAAALAGDNAGVHNNLGTTLQSLGRLAEAEAAFRLALECEPNSAMPHYNLAQLLCESGRAEAALQHFRRAFAARPHHAGYALSLCHQAQMLADWDCVDATLPIVAEALLPGAPPFSAPPFSVLAMPGLTRQSHRAVATNFARLHLAAHVQRGRMMALPHGRDPGSRLRIGYLSADFHDHATARLLAEIIELHDRDRFEIFAYSCAAGDNSAMRARLLAGFDHFIDICDLTPEQAARRIHADGITILVDLKGHTRNGRIEILAYRPAPVQVHWLGYPGTLGTDFVDYLIGDPVVTPAAHRADYAEHLACLPHSYQPNDRRRPRPPPVSRMQAGLPEAAVVLVCFCQLARITLQAFDLWCRLLKAVPDTVLWLLEDGAVASDRLRRRVAAAGIDPRRLVFAPRAPLETHLARLAAADVFLDTLTFNGHTTVSDALWMGVPVVTLRGETFPSRVAAGLVTAAGLPELAVDSSDDYFQLARDLALDGPRRRALRQQLEILRQTSPLFDTQRFTRNLERLFETMRQRWLEGKEPAEIRLDDTGGASALELFGAGNFDAALAACQTLLKSRAGDGDLLNLAGAAALQSGKPDQAEAFFAQALLLFPAAAQLHSNLALARKRQGDDSGAIHACRRALELEPGCVEAHYNLALVLYGQGRFAQALPSLRQAAALAPNNPDIWNDLANTLAALGQAGDARSAYLRALEIRPNHMGAIYNAALLAEQDRKWQIDLLRRGVGLRSDWLSGRLLLWYLLHYEARWDEAAEHEGFIRRSLQDGRMDRVANFALLAFPAASRDDQLRAARNHAAKNHAVNNHAVARPPAVARQRLRIGYLSADFHDHATSRLMVEVLERHDRARVEIWGYSFGPDDGSALRHRMVAAFDHFVEIGALTDSQAAERIRQDGIDILVDLKGYTLHGRTNILAGRPAPVQVSWLGYPGTLGADYVDYLISDPVVTPLDHGQSYAEKLALMPLCYQPNDSRRSRPAPLPRHAYGLPERGIVFCCFNQNYKITRQLFGVWCRLLAEVPGSVLWLLAMTPTVMDAMRLEAAGHGIDPDRIIAAPPMEQSLHMARLGAADIVLDTLPCNAHTTASDALWMGVPVITCMGDTFAGRVASSLLNAAGLAQLVAFDLKGYFTLVKTLASDPERLAAAKAVLADPWTLPLFDAGTFVGELEALYRAMQDRALRNLDPAPLGPLSTAPLAASFAAGGFDVMGFSIGDHYGVGME